MYEYFEVLLRHSFLLLSRATPATLLHCDRNKLVADDLTNSDQFYYPTARLIFSRILKKLVPGKKLLWANKKYWMKEFSRDFFPFSNGEKVNLSNWIVKNS